MRNHRAKTDKPKRKKKSSELCDKLPRAFPLDTSAIPRGICLAHLQDGQEIQVSAQVGHQGPKHRWSSLPRWQCSTGPNLVLTFLEKRMFSLCCAYDFPYTNVILRSRAQSKRQQCNTIPMHRRANLQNRPRMLKVKMPSSRMRSRVTLRMP